MVGVVRTGAQVGRAAAAGARLATTARALGRLAGNMARAARVAAQMTRLAKAVKPIKAGAKAVGRGFRSKAFKSVRNAVWITSDTAQLGYVTYEIVREVKAALAAKAAAKKFKEARERRQKERERLQGEAEEGEEQQQQQSQEEADEEGGKSSSKWYYRSKDTGETVWLHSVEEAYLAHEAGEVVHVKEGAEEEVVAYVDANAAGRRRRRREAQPGGRWRFFDPKTGSTVLTYGIEQALDAFLEGVKVTFLSDAGPEFLLGVDEETGEPTLTLIGESGGTTAAKAAKAAKAAEAAAEEPEPMEDDDDYYEERDPEKLVRKYLEDPGKGTLSDLGLIAGASFVESYVGEKMSPEERERWNSLYPRWSAEIRDEKESTQEIMRRYLFMPSAANLEDAIYRLGMNFVRSYAEKKGRVERQDSANATVWQTTARLLEERMLGDDLIYRHVTRPEMYPLEEVVDRLGAEYLEDFSERTARYLERMSPAVKQRRKEGMVDMSLEVADTLLSNFDISLVSFKRLHEAINGRKKLPELPGPDWRGGKNMAQDWRFSWAPTWQGGKLQPFDADKGRLL